MGAYMINAKRFWVEVSVVTHDDGFCIKLDERDLLTPLKSKLIIPTRGLADEIASEWDAVKGEINPENLPMTKRANSAIERVGTQRAEITAHLLEYIDSDLLCYRAEGPDSLVKAQNAWDEWIAWAKDFDITLEKTHGIMPIAQPEGNKESAKIWLNQWDDFEFTSIYDFISLGGSFVLGMALSERKISTSDCFNLSIIDEVHQESIWGTDDEALALRENKQAELKASDKFFMLCRQDKLT